MRFLEIDALLDAAADHVFPAAQLVIGDGGKEIYARQVGCDSHTLFDIASLTKPLATTTIAMQLIDEGTLSLDDDVALHGARAKIWHLLAHAAGLPAWTQLSKKGVAESRAEIVTLARNTPLLTAPGTRSLYSDLGFIVLGDELERRTGRTIDELFATRVRAPLQLDIGYSPTEPARCAATEAGLIGVVHDENARTMGGIAPHAGLFATASAVSRLVANLLQCHQGQAGIVRPETIQKFWQPSGIVDSTWCLGWDRPAQNDSSAGALWPRDGVGHLGFTGCSIWIDVARARWVVLLSNRVCPTRANDEVKRFRPQLHDAVSRVL